jgi:segregation and condensation protein B
MTDTDSTETLSEATEATENDQPQVETNEHEQPQVDAAEGDQPEGETEAQTGELDPQLLRLLEAVLFASAEPMDEATIATRLPEGSDVPRLVAALAEQYENRGVNLVQAGGKWLFRTAEDLAPAMRVYANPQRKLSRAAIETLAIVAYHQPITRAEMEEIRGVGLSKGTIDMLFEQGWITPRGRRQTPGKPVTWGSTDKFLTDFGIESLESLPGMDELKAAGLLDKRPAIQITDAALPEEEEPLSPEEQERLAEDAAFLASIDNEQGEAGEADAAPAEAREEASEDSDEDSDDDDDESEDEDDDADDDGDDEDDDDLDEDEDEEADLDDEDEEDGGEDENEEDDPDEDELDDDLDEDDDEDDDDEDDDDEDEDGDEEEDEDEDEDSRSKHRD